MLHTIKAFKVIDHYDMPEYIPVFDTSVECSDNELDGYAFDARCIAIDVTEYEDFDWVTVAIYEDGRVIKAIDFDRHHEGSVDPWYGDDIAKQIA